MPRILVVEDDSNIRSMFARALASLGQVDEAGNGAMAISLLGQRAYDFVLLDLYLSGLDGFAVLEWLDLVGDLNRQTPVGVVTGDASVKTTVRAKRANVKFLLNKPVRIHALAALVADSLRKRAGMPSPSSP
jgi:DNA-binding response OmpR family regulator